MIQKGLHIWCLGGFGVTVYKGHLRKHRSVHYYVGYYKWATPINVMHR